MSEHVATSSEPGGQTGHQQLHNAGNGDDVDNTPPPEPHGESFRPRSNVVTGIEVEPKQIAWLWPGRIPVGKLTILSGPPGVGKTFVSGGLAARVTTGENWPMGAWLPWAKWRSSTAKMRSPML